LNRAGERFMTRYYPACELAPRDVVSRAIIAEMKRTGDTAMYLDVTHMSRKELESRFPQITELCGKFSIDVSTDLIPVRPSAHYIIGGVKVDARGATTVNKLWAVGECSSTGLHGANRLGSNSLLESLVVGARAGEAAGRGLRKRTTSPRPPRLAAEPREQATGLIDLDDVTRSLQSVMWRHAGIERDADGLGRAAAQIDFWCEYVMKREFLGPEGWELQNRLTAAKLIVNLALAREESRGVHHRADFPETDQRWRRHQTVRRAAAGRSRTGKRGRSR
jgi:L-aspartate oxidase